MNLQTFDPFSFMFLWLGVGTVVLILVACLKGQKPQKTVRERQPAKANSTDYSHRTHYSDRQKRMIQKAKDQELADYVTNGNKAWALQQLQQQTDPVMVEGLIEDALLINDPFDF